MKSKTLEFARKRKIDSSLRWHRRNAITW